MPFESRLKGSQFLLNQLPGTVLIPSGGLLVFFTDIAHLNYLREKLQYIRNEYSQCSIVIADYNVSKLTEDDVSSVLREMRGVAQHCRWTAVILAYTDIAHVDTVNKHRKRFSTLSTHADLAYVLDVVDSNNEAMYRLELIRKGLATVPWTEEIAVNMDPVER